MCLSPVYLTTLPQSLERSLQALTTRAGVEERVKIEKET